MDILLIHPPLSRPCEPPPGLARLAGSLRDRGKPCLVVDANMEGILHLLAGGVDAPDTFTRRAVGHLNCNLADIRSGDAFRDMGRYTRAVHEISRILAVSARQYDTQLNLNNFQHDTMSPLRSADLIRSAEQPRTNVFHPYFMSRLNAVLEEHTPRIIGLSLNFLSQALTTFAMIGHIRSLDYGAKIVLGGGLVTSWMKKSGWNNPFSGLVDETVAGPGEEMILRLAGIDSPGTDHVPDYAPFMGHAYLSPGLVLPFSASWGCYWGRCSFCPERSEGNAYSCIPAQGVPPQVNGLAVRHSPSLVHFTDNAMSPGVLTALARQGIHAPWYGFARFTSHLRDEDFCMELKRSGCVMLQLGLESGDQAVLDSLDKGIKLEDACKALKNLRKAGIGTYVYLLFGTPAEDEQSARMTLDFVSRQAGEIDFLNLSIFNLPRGGEEAQGLVTFDFFEGDLSLYQGFVHPAGWDRTRVRQFLDKEFRRHPAISPIVRNDPPFFTSNHAPFFLMKQRFFTGFS